MGREDRAGRSDRLSSLGSQMAPCG